MSTPTIPNPFALDFSDLVDEVEALTELRYRIALALLTWGQATAGMDDDEYDFLRSASSAGRLIDALDTFGSSFGAADLGATLV